MEETKKNGLSKGCIVGIVIVGVIVVLMVVGGILCYANKDALIKMGMSTVVSSVKVQLAEPTVVGVDTVAYCTTLGIDTVAYNAVADGFLKKLDAEEELDPDKMAAFGAQMQALSTRMDNLTAKDINSFMDAMIEYYPDLKDLVPAEIPVEELTEETPETTTTEE